MFHGISWGRGEGLRWTFFLHLLLGGLGMGGGFGTYRGVGYYQGREVGLEMLGMGGRVGGWVYLHRDGGGKGRGWVGKDLMYVECVPIHNTTYTTYLLPGSVISRSDDYHLWALSIFISLILITKLLWQS